jgi:hypothetical protein
MDVHGWNGKDFEGRFCHFSGISIAQFIGSALLRDVPVFESTKVLSIGQVFVADPSLSSTELGTTISKISSGESNLCV